MPQQRIVKPLNDTIIVEGQVNSVSVPVGVGMSVFIKHHDLTDTAKTFTAAAETDIITLAAAATDKHPRTGLKGRFTTTTTLPAGLALATDYWLIETGTASQCKVASSLANAKAGVAIDITDAGTGTHTFTPSTGGTRSLALEFSIDGSNWTNVVSLNGASATTYSAVTLSSTAATLMYDLSLYQGMANVRLTTTLGDGQARMSFIVSHNND